MTTQPDFGPHHFQNVSKLLRYHPIQSCFVGSMIVLFMRQPHHTTFPKMRTKDLSVLTTAGMFALMALGSTSPVVSSVEHLQHLPLSAWGASSIGRANSEVFPSPQS
jgi:hypothetical protein